MLLWAKPTCSLLSWSLLGVWLQMHHSTEISMLRVTNHHPTHFSTALLNNIWVPFLSPSRINEISWSHDLILSGELSSSKLSPQQIPLQPFSLNQKLCPAHCYWSQKSRHPWFSLSSLIPSTSRSCWLFIQTCPSSAHIPPLLKIHRFLSWQCSSLLNGSLLHFSPLQPICHTKSEWSLKQIGSYHSML